MKVKVCIGSSCHLKGSREIAERLMSLVGEHKLEDDVVVAGSFCIGKCNREGVTIQIDDEIYTGVTPQNFDAFFNEHILEKAR